MLGPLEITLLCLGLSFICSEIFFRVRLPKIIGQIIAGVIIGLPVFKFLISGSGSNFIFGLSELGVVFLLFLTGLEIDIQKFKSLSKNMAIIAIISAATPFILGTLIGYAMHLHKVFPFAPFILGASLSITSTGANAKILMDFKKETSRLGQILIGSAAIDDFFGTVFLTIVLVILHQTANLELALFPLKLIMFVLVAFVLLKIFPKIFDVIAKEKSDSALFSIAILFCLIISVTANYLGLSTILGALIAGVLMKISTDKNIENAIFSHLKVITYSLVIPFFFIAIGMAFDIASLFENFNWVCIIFFVAVIGKIAGPIVWSLISKEFSLRQALLLGLGMNSRGAIELVVAKIALAYNLIPQNIYSAIVTTAVLTTLIFPIALKRELSINEKIMD
ncbi:MAG: hypothetical protein DRO04_00250 [Candidatus Iainarchaeum archaeon]|uniref:Cation/H+ exchanger transmembrane domain-containing protein n=1 Tax=Candidatus Iainarchaeum sp. TaxID=3101447 RepID=A0A497JI91_9ARCH|nr:MAG: hypothetical protein DRO04_00250 [Candidatus Diapherotrites archaeon]